MKPKTVSKSKHVSDCMKAVIHQPYFLPWMGYFSKLVYADKFIVLDNVNFTKGSFIDRVQIINAQGEPMWTGLPIGQHLKKRCNEIIFSDNKAVENIIKCFYSAYSKAQHFKENIDKIETILMRAIEQSNQLCDINMFIIVKIMELLKIDMPEVIFSSNFRELIDSTDRLIMLLKENKCDTLITGSGGSLDAHNIDIIAKSGINIYLQDYYKFHPLYYQTRRKFIGFAKGLSIVDCIFNEGIEQTKNFLYDNSNIPQLYLSSKIINN